MARCGISRKLWGQTILKKMVRYLFPSHQITENFRPKWLNRLEIDIWIPDLQIGFEFDGDQHEFPIYGLDALMGQMERDTIKERICRERGTVLIHAEASELSCDLVRKKIKNFYYQVYMHFLPIKEARLKAQLCLHVLQINNASEEAKELLDSEAEKYRKYLREIHIAPSAFTENGDRWKLTKSFRKTLTPESRNELKRKRWELGHLKRSPNANQGFAECLPVPIYTPLPDMIDIPKISKRPTKIPPRIFCLRFSDLSKIKLTTPLGSSFGITDIRW